MYLCVSPFDRNIHSQISICFAQVQRVIVLETKSILSKRTLPGFIKLIPWMFLARLATMFPLEEEEKRGVQPGLFDPPVHHRLVPPRLYVAISRGGSLHPCEPLRYSKWRHGTGVGIRANSLVFASCCPTAAKPASIARSRKPCNNNSCAR